MRGGAEEDHGGDQCEQGEGQEAESVQHDGRVLPVVHHQHGLLAGPDGVCDDSAKNRELSSVLSHHHQRNREV